MAKLSANHSPKEVSMQAKKHTTPKIFSVRLRSLLARSGMKFQDLAAEMGVRSATVSQWTNGHSLPSLDKWAKLSEVVGSTEAELFFDSTETNINVNEQPAPYPGMKNRMKVLPPFDRGRAGYGVPDDEDPGDKPPSVSRAACEAAFAMYLDQAEAAGALPVAWLAIRKHLDPRDFDYFNSQPPEPETEKE